MPDWVVLDRRLQSLQQHTWSVCVGSEWHECGATEPARESECSSVVRSLQPQHV